MREKYVVSHRTASQADNRVATRAAHARARHYAIKMRADLCQGNRGGAQAPAAGRGRCKPPPRPAMRSALSGHREKPIMQRNRRQGPEHAG